MPAPLLDLLAQHKPVAAVLLTTTAWPFLSGMVTALLRYDTPEAWEAWAATRPESALAVEILRAFGVDAIKFRGALRRYAERKVGLKSGIVVPVPGAPPPAPTPPVEPPPPEPPVEPPPPVA